MDHALQCAMAAAEGCLDPGMLEDAGESLGDLRSRWFAMLQSLGPFDSSSSASSGRLLIAGQEVGKWA